MGLKFEAWTLPTAATFEKKFDISEALPGATGVRELSAYTDASLPVPSSWDRIDDLIATDDASLVAVYDQDTSGNKVLVDEFIAQRCPFSTQRPGTRTISGPGINGIVEKCAVFPVSDLVTDWKWGSTQNLISNPGFENSAVTSRVFELTITATGGTYTLSDGTDTTSSIDFNANSATITTRIQTDLGLFVDVVVTQSGTSPRKYVVTMVDPAYGVTLSVNTGSLTGGSATVNVTESGGLSPSSWTVAKTIGSSGGAYTTFTVTDVRSHTGTYSLEVNPAPSSLTSNRWPGAQTSASVDPGLAQAGIWVYPTSGTDTFQLFILGVGEEVIAYSTNGTLTVNNWNQITIDDLEIPEGVSEVIFRLYCTNPGPSDPSPFFVDDAELFEGPKATTADDIVRTLLQAAQARGTFGFLEVDAAAGEDSLGNTLDDISFIARYGQDLGHVLNGLNLLGINWRIVRADQALAITPAGTTTHVLQLFDVGEVPVDHTASAGGPSILGGDATVVKRIPDYTAVRARGAGDLYVDDTNASALANMGRWEKIIDAEDVASAAALQLLIDHRFSEEDLNQKAASANVLYTDASRPLVRFDAGDRVWWQFPGILPKEARVVKRVAWTYGTPTSYQVQGSKVLSSEGGIAQAVDYLLRQFTRRAQEPEPAAPVVGGGAGGAFTITIAAADALDIEKEKADLFCTGSNDLAVWDQAKSIIEEQGNPEGGRIVLSSGTFSDTPTGNSQILLNLNTNDGITVEGQGPFNTILSIAATGNTNTTIIQSSNYGSFKNFSIIGGSGSGHALLLSDYCRAENMYIATGFDGIATSGTNIKITDNWIECTGSSIVGAASFGPVTITGNHLFLTTGTCVDGSGDKWNITGNWFSGGTWSIESASGDAEWVVTSNHFRNSGGLLFPAASHMVIAHNEFETGQISFTGAATYSTVEGNTFEAASVNTNAGAISFAGTAAGCTINGNTLENVSTEGILLTGGSRCTISGNTIPLGADIGILLDTCDNCTVSDNTIEWAAEHGIHILDSSNNNLSGNTIFEPGQGTDNTYDGILLSGNSDDNFLHGNKVFSRASSPQARYGVNVSASTCDRTIYVANDCYPSANFGTAAYNDAGTGSVNTMPAAGGAQGDNFQ